MYCIKCGVELADNESKCPLCSTIVYHPDIQKKEDEKSYPVYMKSDESVNRNGVNFILSIVSILLALISVLCDVNINKRLTWSPYVLDSVVFFYVVVVLPLWFRKPNPVIFVPVDFACLALFLFYICYLTNGAWFFSLTLPIVIYAAMIATTVITLVRYVKRGYLYIFGGAVIAIGPFAILIEYVINHTFHIRNGFLWSIYPLVTFVIVGFSLFLIAMNKSLREYFHRKFFI